MKKQANEKYVLERTFKKFTEGTFKKFVENDFSVLKSSFKEFTEVTFKNEINRLDSKIDNVALLAVKTQDIVAHMQQDMVTKRDLAEVVDKISNKIDSFVGKTKEFDQEQLVQGLHIKELKETTRQHEQRITSLEAHLTT